MRRKGREEERERGREGDKEGGREDERERGGLGRHELNKNIIERHDRDEILTRI